MKRSIIGIFILSNQIVKLSVKARPLFIENTEHTQNTQQNLELNMETFSILYLFCKKFLQLIKDFNQNELIIDAYLRCKFSLTVLVFIYVLELKYERLRRVSQVATTPKSLSFSFFNHFKTFSTMLLLGSFYNNRISRFLLMIFRLDEK